MPRDNGHSNKHAVVFDSFRPLVTMEIAEPGTVAEFRVHRILRDDDFLHHVRRRDIAGLDADANAAAVHLKIVGEVGAAADAHAAGSPAIERIVFCVASSFRTEGSSVASTKGLR